MPFYNKGTPNNQTHVIGCEIDTFNRCVQGPRGIANFPQNGRGGQRNLMNQLDDSKEPLTFCFHFR